MSTTLIESGESRPTGLSAWAGAGLAVALVVTLLLMATLNVVDRATWHAVDDGILWEDQSDGVTAVGIAENDVISNDEVQVGDLLRAIDGTPVETTGDVVGALHDGRLNVVRRYTLQRAGQSQLLGVVVSPVAARPTQIYFVMVGIGVFGLLIGSALRLTRPEKPGTLHFFWLSVAFFGMFAFSFTERLDSIDWVFYWADAVSTLALGPMLVHFSLNFRGIAGEQHKTGYFPVLVLYGLAGLLGTFHVVLLASDAASAIFQERVDLFWRLQFTVLGAHVFLGVGLMLSAIRRMSSVAARRQLGWIVGGVVVGGLPSMLGYALPRSLGFNPIPIELVVVPLGLVPLAFGAAIVGYRLRDVEVFVKRGLGYTGAVLAMVTIYFVLVELSQAVFQHQFDGHDSVIILLSTAIVVLIAVPVRTAIQSMLDRAYYRERYDHRIALRGFARDLNTEHDLDRLARRLVEKVRETLASDRTVLMLWSAEHPAGVFEPFRASGVGSLDAWPALAGGSTIGTRLCQRHTVILEDPASSRYHPEEEVEFWRDQGVQYFVPCISGERTIAALLLGAKPNGDPLSSDDVALLTVVSGQVATAIENGRLYSELRAKVSEVERIRKFSDDIIESLNVGLVVLDLEDQVTWWNRAIERIYGVPREHAIGSTLSDLFEPSFVTWLEQFRQGRSGDGMSSRQSISSRHQGGRRQLLAEVTVSLLQTSESDTSGTMVLIEDITEQVRLEEQLKLSDKMASMGLLAAGVAHEVNTPLTGISSFTQMLREKTEADDPRIPLLEKIESQTSRASKIVNGLLNLAKPGRTDAAGPVDLNVVIDEVAALLEHQFKISNIQIRYELSSTPATVQGVEFKLQQVFLNLFLNAKDAMPTGGDLSVTLRIENQQVVVEVADTGGGITSEELSRIYDPFFTTKVAGKGTGLGLSIAYGVVKEHNGSIQCESEPGQGARFTVTLPSLSRSRERLRPHG